MAEGTDDDSMLRRLESKFGINTACVDGVSDAARKDVGRGFAMSGVSSDAYLGFQLFPYGVQLGADRVHATTYPLAGESVDAYVKRCCVKVAAEDAEVFDPVDERTFSLNALNSDPKSSWVNAREWTDQRAAELTATQVWVLCDAPLETIRAMQSSANPWAQAESLREWTTCAVFVKR